MIELFSFWELTAFAVLGIGIIAGIIVGGIMIKWIIEDK